VGISKGADAQQIRVGAEEAMAEAGVPGEVLVLRPDLHGLVLEGQAAGDESGDVYDFNTGG
jgi:hypothetical protein